MEISIRPYTPADTDRLVAIWQAASTLAHPFLDDGFQQAEAENLRTLYLPNAETHVLIEGGAPIGFIALIDREIGGLFLSPDHHGRGLGRKMVDHAHTLKGSLTVEVFEQNRIGRAFYDRYGFVETDRYHHKPSGQMTLVMAVN